MSFITMQSTNYKRHEKLQQKSKHNLIGARAPCTTLRPTIDNPSQGHVILQRYMQSATAGQAPPRPPTAVSGGAVSQQPCRG